MGEAGIGKTRLTAELAQRLLDAGDRVAVARCSPVDRSTPYRMIAEALAGAARTVARPNDIPRLAPYLPAVERFLPHWRSAAGVAGESPAIVGESLLRVLAWLAAGSAMIVVLEDLHWADPDTVAVCEYLLDHLDGTPVAVVATARRGEVSREAMSVLRRSAVLDLRPSRQGRWPRWRPAALPGRLPPRCSTGSSNWPGGCRSSSRTC
jgi:predicted ATPase